ncbi:MULTISPECIES: N-acetylmuramoyl-L-alanine amidase [unclassified Aureispira]|uniref:N-acetylmuramoyl-L-alanine amidase n=1 Tax=unclassified Aureispira TaxID=2649989 RepID=UPI0006990381|nr:MULTISPECIES: peptidoglycan-binding protein [unclassified Aureispira]WMX15233.1 peptidoglycan-binding protein [Aureispira sp. CCB-E]
MKRGDKGPEVRILQYKLRKVLNRSLSIDGDYGPSTEAAVRLFQSLYDLVVDGHAGPKTNAKLDVVYRAMFNKNSDLLHFGKRRFVVFVDAGHGGIDENGKYVTPGKRAYHKGEKMHERGHYYEGYENRLIAESFIEACTDAGIMCVRTYHPYKDTSLSQRTEIVRSWLRRGYYGYLHSFHSNAISSSNTPAKLDATRGFMIFNTRGNNFSDKIATQHFENVQAAIGKSNWKYRAQTRGDGDVDFEVNFQILRETDLQEFNWFGAILEEWGFHTSKTDANFIIKPENRKKRVAASLKTAKWVKKELNKIINP